MVRHKKDERVAIKGGKCKDHETAVFKKYSGLVSAVVVTRVDGEDREKTVRLASLEPMPATPLPGEMMKIERGKCNALLEEVSRLGEAVEELKHRLEELEIN